MVAINARTLRHLLLPDWWPLRHWPGPLRARIQEAIRRSETLHQAELRLVIEAGLPLACLKATHTARDRAIELFARLGVWDTEENSGVLIYLQLIDRRVEIVADRGIHARVGQAFWDQVCRDMEAEFRAGRMEAGALAAIAAITAVLVAHFPAAADNRNELPDDVVVL
jgi:uncharacterized membrane protein